MLSPHSNQKYNNDFVYIIGNSNSKLACNLFFDEKKIQVNTNWSLKATFTKSSVQSKQTL